MYLCVCKYSLVKISRATKQKKICNSCQLKRERAEFQPAHDSPLFFSLSKYFRKDSNSNLMNWWMTGYKMIDDSVRKKRINLWPTLCMLRFFFILISSQFHWQVRISKQSKNLLSENDLGEWMPSPAFEHTTAKTAFLRWSLKSIHVRCEKHLASVISSESAN